MIRKNLNKKRPGYTIDLIKEMANGVQSADRYALAQAITLVESTQPTDEDFQFQLFAELGTQLRKSICVAITGPPGVGKSSFIESMGIRAIADGYQVAVLPIDPSSELTRGSILGDKTRMPSLSKHPRAFVRPSPSSGDLGGINNRTWEVKQICEFASFDLIFVETVGVGQSESEVRHLADMLTLLYQPGAGDDIQQIKRGINEVADFFIINKADGRQLELANEAKTQVLASAKFSNTEIINNNVVLHSTEVSEVADSCWNLLKERMQFLISSGRLNEKKQAQNEYWLNKKCTSFLLNKIRLDVQFQSKRANLIDQLRKGELDVFNAYRFFVQQTSIQFISNETVNDQI